MTTSPGITVQVSLEVADALDAALEYIEERLIGEVPEQLQNLLQAVADADSRAMQLVGNAGQSFVGEEQAELTAEQEADIASYEAWLDSPEGQAESAAAEQFDAWRREQRGRVTADYRIWLDRCAKNFDRSRRAWHKARRAQLRTEYESQTTN